MKVLVITHQRSGGRSLTNWISNEMKLFMVHEVFNNDMSPELIKKTYIGDDIVVKVICEKLRRRYIDVYDLARRFDKVICHTRNNDIDTAISVVYQLLNPQSGLENPNWHEIYKIDDKWLSDNQDMIDKELEWMETCRKEIEKLNLDCLRTTYEDVYETKKDIPRLINYLGLRGNILYYLDILDKRHKLQNGTVGIGSIIKTPDNKYVRRII
jgi:hypothetical protein